LQRPLDLELIIPQPIRADVPVAPSPAHPFARPDRMVTMEFSEYWRAHHMRIELRRGVLRAKRIRSDKSMDSAVCW
jgi:hypothetical protein